MPGTGRKSIAQDCMQVLQILVSETRQKRSQKYLVSESWGAPIFTTNICEKCLSSLRC